MEEGKGTIITPEKSKNHSKVSDMQITSLCLLFFIFPYTNNNSFLDSSFPLLQAPASFLPLWSPFFTVAQQEKAARAWTTSADGVRGRQGGVKVSF